MSGPKVSVGIVTYNHAPYIAQAIESALTQKTDFEFELVIGEDESSDGTREIVANYADRYPERIRAHFRSRNDVIYVDGRATGRFNFLQTLRDCRGEYVAVLEGDDYWTDPQKLQKQVDLLSGDPGCAACFHNVEITYEDNRPSRMYRFDPEKTSYNLADVLAGRMATPTCSSLFRRDVIEQISTVPEAAQRLPMFDLVLYVLAARTGSLRFINEPMAVYRNHAGGVWSAGGEHRWDAVRAARRHEAIERFCEAMLAWLGPEVAESANLRLATSYYDLAWCYQQQGDLRCLRNYLWKAIRSAPRHPDFSFGHKFKQCILAFVPGAFGWYRRRQSKAAGRAPAART